MNAKNGLIKMTFLAMMVAIGVVISPILRVEGNVPDGPFDQYCLCGDDGTVVFIAVRYIDRHYPHDVYGNTAAGFNGSSFRRFFVRRFISIIRGKNDFRGCRRGDRHRYYRGDGVLSGDDIYCGTRRTFSDVLCSVLYLRNIDRRQRRFYLFEIFK